jgi:hypothetical protein
MFKRVSPTQVVVFPAALRHEPARSAGWRCAEGRDSLRGAVHDESCCIDLRVEHCVDADEVHYGDGYGD